jgi:hypothetical protein
MERRAIVESSGCLGPSAVAFRAPDVLDRPASRRPIATQPEPTNQPPAATAADANQTACAFIYPEELGDLLVIDKLELYVDGGRAQP